MNRWLPHFQLAMVALALVAALVGAGLDWLGFTWDF